MKKILILTYCLVVVLGVATARASMFDFHFGSLTSTWDGTSSLMTSTNPDLTAGSLTRQQTPTGEADFLAGQWGLLGGNFGMAMTLTNITGSSADGAGSFAITDTTGDVISGNLTGTWSHQGVSNIFSGLLNNVTFADNSTDAAFNGHSGSVSMAFPQAMPWYGSLIQLSTTSGWFTDGAYTTNSGSVDASVVHEPVPEPATMLLFGAGLVGLAGFGRKRFKK